MLTFWVTGSGKGKGTSSHPSSKAWEGSFQGRTLVGALCLGDLCPRDLTELPLSSVIGSGRRSEPEEAGAGDVLQTE